MHLFKLKNRKAKSFLGVEVRTLDDPIQNTQMALRVTILVRAQSPGLAVLRQYYLLAFQTYQENRKRT